MQKIHTLGRAIGRRPFRHLPFFFSFFLRRLVYSLGFLHFYLTYITLVLPLKQNRPDCSSSHLHAGRDQCRFLVVRRGKKDTHLSQQQPAPLLCASCCAATHIYIRAHDPKQESDTIKKWNDWWSLHASDGSTLVQFSPSQRLFRTFTIPLRRCCAQKRTPEPLNLSRVNNSKRLLVSLVVVVQHQHQRQKRLLAKVRIVRVFAHAAQV